MGLEDVKQDILNEAENKADEILEEAESEKDDILEEAENEAERIREESEEKIDERKKSLEKKAVSNANMEAKQKKLEAKEKALDEAFERFDEELGDLSDDDRESMLENCIEEAEFDVGLVRGGESFEGLTDKEFESADMDGFVLVSDDGERRLNFTFDKIVDDFRNSYRKEVAEKLFN